MSLLSKPSVFRQQTVGMLIDIGDVPIDIKSCYPFRIFELLNYEMANTNVNYNGKLYF
jgi:hypothetical protein